MRITDFFINKNLCNSWQFVLIRGEVFIRFGKMISIP